MAQLKKYYRGLKRNNSDIGNSFSSTSLCVINDNEFVREGLVSLLKCIPNLINSKGFAMDDFVNLADTTRYGIIITEIEFGNRIDLELIRVLRMNYPDAKIIVYTNFKNSHYRTSAILAGTDFYLFMEDKYNLLEHLIKGLLNQVD